MGLIITKFDFTDKTPGVKSILTEVFSMYNVHLELFVNGQWYNEEAASLLRINVEDGREVCCPTICDVASRKLRRYGGVRLHKNQHEGRKSLAIWWEPFDRNLVLVNMLSAALQKLGGIKRIRTRK